MAKPFSILAKPYTVRINGELRRVVGTISTNGWIEELATRRRVANIGKLHKKVPAPTKVIRKSKICSKCKQPAWTTTDRGRALHVSCEGFADTLPDDVRWQMLTDYATHANAEIL